MVDDLQDPLSEVGGVQGIPFPVGAVGLVDHVRAADPDQEIAAGRLVPRGAAGANAGAGLAGLTGLLTLGGARRMRYFQVRREAVLRGWGRLFASVILLGAGCINCHAATSFGPPPKSPRYAALVISVPTVEE